MKQGLVADPAYLVSHEFHQGLVHELDTIIVGNDVDAVIEAVGHPDEDFVLGIQGHFHALLGRDVARDPLNMLQSSVLVAENGAGHSHQRVCPVLRRMQIRPGSTDRIPWPPGWNPGAGPGLPRGSGPASRALSIEKVFQVVAREVGDSLVEKSKVQSAPMRK